ncbi:unnamed protein product, partial [Ilex paraguariensis]
LTSPHLIVNTSTDFASTPLMAVANFKCLQPPKVSSGDRLFCSDGWFCSIGGFRLHKPTNRCYLIRKSDQDFCIESKVLPLTLRLGTLTFKPCKWELEGSSLEMPSDEREAKMPSGEREEPFLLSGMKA